MLIRIATVADAASIAHIHVETWRSAYRGQIPEAVLDALDVERRTVFWEGRLAQAGGTIFITEGGDEIVGFCDLIPSRDRDAEAKAVGEIAAIYLLPKCWRKGIGRALCSHALAAARSLGYQTVTLWVLVSNWNARHFYEAMGFRLDGASKREKLTDESELQEVRFSISI